MKIDASGRSGSFGTVAIREGDVATGDGTTGLVFCGEVPVKKAKPKLLLEEIQRWRKSSRRAVRAS